MKITYTASQITNPILAHLRQWVINCQEFILDDEEVIDDMKELARLLEFWRSKYNTAEASDIEVMLFSDCSILIKDVRRAEYIRVDRLEEEVHNV